MKLTAVVIFLVSTVGSVLCDADPVSNSDPDPAYLLTLRNSVPTNPYYPYNSLLNYNSINSLGLTPLVGGVQPALGLSTGSYYRPDLVSPAYQASLYNPLIANAQQVASNLYLPQQQVIGQQFSGQVAVGNYLNNKEDDYLTEDDLDLSPAVLAVKSLGGGGVGVNRFRYAPTLVSPASVGYLPYDSQLTSSTGSRRYPTSLPNAWQQYYNLVKRSADPEPAADSDSDAEAQVGYRTGYPYQYNNDGSYANYGVASSSDPRSLVTSVVGNQQQQQQLAGLNNYQLAAATGGLGYAGNTGLYANNAASLYSNPSVYGANVGLYNANTGLYNVNSGLYGSGAAVYGLNLNNDLYSNSGLNINDLYGRSALYRSGGQQANNLGLLGQQSLYPNNGLYTNNGLYPNTGLYPNNNLYANNGLLTNTGVYANNGLYANSNGLYANNGLYTNTAGSSTNSGGLSG